MTIYMCWNKMNLMSQDEITVMKLNQLLLQMRTDFLSVNNSLSRTGYGELLFHGKTKDQIPWRSTFHEVNESNKTGTVKSIDTIKRQRKRSLPILSKVIENQIIVPETEVIDKLNDLLGRLENIGESSPLSTIDRNLPVEDLYAKIDRSKKYPRALNPRAICRDHCKIDRNIFKKENLSHIEPTTHAHFEPTQTHAHAQFNEHVHAHFDSKHVQEEEVFADDEEPQYATIDDIETAHERRRCATLGERGPHGGMNEERYRLDDASRYLTNSLFTRHFSTTVPKRRDKYPDLGIGFIKKFPSDGMINSVTLSQEHSTLCRRLKTLEASVGITLKKQLHFFVKKKMKVMNVDGCVYCMYAFYEKHKREADEKAKQIRNTIKEQELLQQQLNEQKEQSDADRLWLESEEPFSQLNKTEASNEANADSNNNSEGLHESGTKSESEQLGYDLYKEDYARDILEKKMEKKATSPVRRSIPLWGFERNELTRDQTSPDQEALSVTPTSESTASTTLSSSNRCETSDTMNSPSPDDGSVPATPDSSLDSGRQVSPDIETPSSSSLNNSDSDNSKSNKDINNDSECNSDSKSTTTPEPSTPTSVTDVDSDVAVDHVYQQTTRVVKSVIELNTGVEHAHPDEFIDLVKVVGLNLRDLLSAVDKEISHIPADKHREIEMAHRVLSSDMAELVGKMKIAQKYADTTLDQQNRRNMLQAAHALAIDAKNLYDTYSKLRTSSDSSR